MKYSRVQAKRKKWGATSHGESCSRCGKCLTKMQLVLLSVLLYSSLTTAAALQLLRLEMPSIVDPRWEKVSLKCVYDLHGQELYSVKWFKDGTEFFRFMPGSIPAGRDYNVKGIFVDVKQSDNKQVTLLGQASADRRDEEVNLAGTYGCEVSSEAPNFYTDYNEANMSVAVPPKTAPALEGVRPSYEVGEILEAECTSGLSYPPAVLTFILNGKEVTRALTKTLPMSGNIDGSVVSTTRLGLTVRLERQHFPGGTLSLTCQSALPDIANVQVLKTIEIATLAASNQRLAQEPPKSGSWPSVGLYPGLICWTTLVIHTSYVMTL
ncbi:PREDICTED: uncharacterized protein LOC106749601 [Dinoponera quadriceps]|uniref:Uncharacterized protein LOC106749601 n=1 Tax=Dinoponera quadriceps TaxID=609295 RepID=A0A6P3Y1P5_DINQU|nr:PREDICTED: uncharacterized protein LOC106749601 [Dinoponera quadriceps]